MKRQAKSAFGPMIENQRLDGAAGLAARPGAARSVRRVAPIAAAGSAGGISRNAVSLPGHVKPVRGSAQKAALPGRAKNIIAAGERGAGRALAGPGLGEGAAPGWFRETVARVAGVVIARNVASAEDRTAASCANWEDGQCHVCGVPQQGYEVAPAFRCPGWRPR